MCLSIYDDQNIIDDEMDWIFKILEKNDTFQEDYVKNMYLASNAQFFNQHLKSAQ